MNTTTELLKTANDLADDYKQSTAALALLDDETAKLMTAGNVDESVEAISEIERERAAIATRQRIVGNKLIEVEKSLEQTAATLADDAKQAEVDYRKAVDKAADDLMASDTAELVKKFIAARACLAKPSGRKDWDIAALQGLGVTKAYQPLPRPGVRYSEDEFAAGDKQAAELEAAARDLNALPKPVTESKHRKAVSQALAQVGALLDEREAEQNAA